MTRKSMHCLTHLVAYILILVVVLAAKCVTAVQENSTIDDGHLGQDEGLTLRYLADDGWIEGNLCQGCSARPDVSFAFNGTWHDATSMHDDKLQRVIEFNFTGTISCDFTIAISQSNYSQEWRSMHISLSPIAFHSRP